MSVNFNQCLRKKTESKILSCDFLIYQGTLWININCFSHLKLFREINLQNDLNLLAIFTEFLSKYFCLQCVHSHTVEKWKITPPQCDIFNIFPPSFFLQKFRQISVLKQNTIKTIKKAFSKSLNSPISQFFAVLWPKDL